MIAKKDSYSNKIVDCIIVFLICFLLRLYISLQAYPVVYGSDEVSAISIAARVAGYDWSDVVSNAGYYGIGFLWIFAPLFKLNLSAVTIYRIMMVVLSFVNALTGPIYYTIMGNYLNVESRMWRQLTASICANCIFLYVSNPCVRNEEISALLISLVVYLLCRIVKYKKVRDEIILILILIYSLTCHTRLIAVSLTVLVIGILYFLFYRKRLFHAFTYIVFIIGAGGAYAFLSLYRSSIWTGGSVRNSSVTSTVTNSISNIIKTGDIFNKIGVWFRIVIGQIFTATTITGGLFLIATVICIVIIVKFFRNTEWKLTEQTTKIKESQIVIAVFALVLVFMTIATMGVTWLSGVYNAIQTYGTEVVADNYRAFSYVRYFGIYVPSLTMVALSYIATQMKTFKKCSTIAILVYSGCLCVWMTGILPYIISSNRQSFSFLAAFSDANNLTANWYKICFLGIIFMTVWLFLRKAKQIEIMLVFCLLLLVCEQIYTFDNTTLVSEMNVYNKANAGTSLIQDLKDVLGEDIYVCDLSDATDHQIFYIYQFLNYTYHVIPGLPEDEDQDFILFTNRQLGNLDENIFSSQLDANEYVYTNVPEYQKEITESLLNSNMS